MPLSLTGTRKTSTEIRSVHPVHETINGVIYPCSNQSESLLCRKMTPGISAPVFGNSSNFDPSMDK